MSDHTCRECGEEIREGDPIWIDHGDDGTERSARHFHRRCHERAAEHDEAVLRSKRQYAAYVEGQRRRGVTDGVSDG